MNTQDVNAFTRHEIDNISSLDLVASSIDYQFFARAYKDFFPEDLNNSDTAFRVYAAHSREVCLDPNEFFNETAYRDVNPDVAYAIQNGDYISGFHHWLCYGRGEGRSSCPKPQASFLPDESGHAVQVTGTPDNQLSGSLPDDGQDEEGVQCEAAAILHDPTIPLFDQDANEGADGNDDAHPERPEDKWMDTIKASGLFDAAWYISTYPELDLATTDDALADFVHRGWRAMRNPNEDFSTRYYLSQNPDVATVNLNPLFHYIVAGDRENRAPSPILDVVWYRATHGIAPGVETCLAHYRRNKHDKHISPTPLFDPEFYLNSYADIAQSGVHPFQHYMSSGHREIRDPSPAFKSTFYKNFYLSQNRNVNPLLHFLEVGKSVGYSTEPSDDILAPAIDARRFAARGKDFEEFESHAGFAGRESAKAIAFYLPQFHAFPENDEWWGSGFTEWTNIAKGMPRFAGHYQPRIPRDLGFYDPTQDGVLERQVELARQAGIHGFCFYFYWFNRKRLLERPLERLLANPEINMPFCLMWANENWTRRWDGQDQEILIQQDYAEEDDVALVDTFLRHFQDYRYIRIDGRPLLIIYRAQIIPDMRERLGRWRAMFLERGEMPLILMAQTFNDNDPRPYGFDGAVEFPPHKVSAMVPNEIMSAKIYDPFFSGQIYSYDNIVDVSLNEPAPPYPLIKTVFPSWDNDARRQGRGAVFHGSTPKSYQRWLEGTLSYAKANPFHNERFVFINAWNEWAEGAYLEPDLHFGAAYLNATARAIYGRQQTQGRTKLLLVGHDAHPHGAQLNLLGIARILARDFGIEIAIVLLGGGPLVGRYNDLAETHVCTTPGEMQSVFEELSAAGFTAALLNTVVTGVAVPVLKEAGFHVTGMIHELPRIIQERNLQGSAANFARMADNLVFACAYVRDRFLELTGTPKAKVVIRPQGLYTPVDFDGEDRDRLRRQLGLCDSTRLVVNIGYADLRKGFDLFLETARAAAHSGLDLHFLWVGNIDPLIKVWLVGTNGESRLPNLTLVGFTDDVAPYYSAADLFFLSSREDPFPTVTMEAINAGLPVVAYHGGGGYAELLEDGRFGRLVPMGDAAAALSALTTLPIDDRQERAGANAAHCRTHFNHRDYAFELLRLGQPSLKKVSVVVPSYNYAHHMVERLESILGQTYPVYEILVLDDASADDSVGVARAVAAATQRTVTIEVNSRNSGSVFAQWRKGAEMASGELLWIAEADDSADPSFLATLCANLDPERSAFAFSDSVAIDPDGNEIMPSYIPYCEAEAPGRFSRNFTLDGWTFARSCLAIKNTVLNVSGVVWSTATLRATLAIVGAELTTFKVAGDWRLYAEAAALGRRVSYIAKALNRHRRHASSVTHDLNKRRHLEEIIRMQDFVAGRLMVDKATIDAANKYVDGLLIQFGIENEKEQSHDFV